MSHKEIGLCVIGFCHRLRRQNESKRKKHNGKSTHIGIGAAVKNNINICADCIVGAGAVVVKDIEERGIYKGVPARLDWNK